MMSRCHPIGGESGRRLTAGFGLNGLDFVRDCRGKTWNGTHRACLFQSEETICRARLKDTFDQGERQSLDAANCYTRDD